MIAKENVEKVFGPMWGGGGDSEDDGGWLMEDGRNEGMVNF
jgi:hypothetical protein